MDVPRLEKNGRLSSELSLGDAGRGTVGDTPKFEKFNLHGGLTSTHISTAVSRFTRV